MVLKKRKWYNIYNTTVKPDRKCKIIVMTDMGYMFEAVYENGEYYTSVVRDNKVYFERYHNQESIVKFMIV